MAVQRVVVKGRSFIIGESRDLKMIFYGAPATGGRARQVATPTLNDVGSDPATIVPDVEDLLDTSFPDNIDPA
jgi:hypothetical protein